MKETKENFTKGQLIKTEIKKDGAYHYTFRIFPSDTIFIRYLRLGGFAKIVYNGDGIEKEVKE